MLVIDAQVRPVYDMGAAGLTQVLQRLQTTASVLHTGAHPDDEDSAFIARTARGDHARVAYLSLNRGEGGQNIIGPELFDALGVIRTEELLQARRLDGAEQFFGHTFDYGFSKSREEAAAKWDEHDTLGDIVRVIRMFRPLVIYSRFSGTPADGHGHHQVAGYLTPLAFKAAADPNRVPRAASRGPAAVAGEEALSRHFGNARPDPANPRRAGAGRDHRSGRRTHLRGDLVRRTQPAQDAGARRHRAARADRVGADAASTAACRRPRPEKSIFDGIDTTIPGLAKLAGLPDGTIRAELAAMDAAAKKALADYEPLDPRASSRRSPTASAPRAPRARR